MNDLIPGSLEDSGVGSDDDTGVSMRNRNNNCIFSSNDSFAESIAPPPIRRSFVYDDPTVEMDPPKPERMLSLLKRQPRKKATPKKNNPSQLVLRRIPKFNDDCVPETPISITNYQKSLNTTLGSGPIDRFVQPIPLEELHKPVPSMEEYRKRIQPHPMHIMKPSPADEAVFKKPFLPVRPTKSLLSVDNYPYSINNTQPSEEINCASFDEPPPAIRKKKHSTSPMIIRSQYNTVLRKPFNPVIVVPHTYDGETDRELEDPKPTSANDSLFDGAVIPALERKTTRQVVSTFLLSHIDLNTLGFHSSTGEERTNNISREFDCWKV